MIADRRIKDGIATLSCHDATSAEGSAVANGVYFEFDGLVGIASAQKVGVHRMGCQAVIYRLVGGQQTLGEYLPTK